MGEFLTIYCAELGAIGRCEVLGVEREMRGEAKARNAPEGGLASILLAGLHGVGHGRRVVSRNASNDLRLLP